MLNFKISFMKNYLVIASLLLMAACAPKEQSKQIDPANFAKEVDGKKVELFTIKNANGVFAQITTFGGRIVNLFVPDANGELKDVVLGYSTIDGYLSSSTPNFGAAIGRYGNRIGNAKFTLNDSTYQLDANDGRNCLHGGSKGYYNVVFDGKQLSDSSMEITYLSKDGEMGFPGNLQVRIVYTMTADNAVKIEYFAETDAPTVCNLTNHAYFNLSGDMSTSINDHILQINADKYTAVDNFLIPTGVLAPVDSTPMDFRTPTAIGARIDADFEQLKIGRGYDHNWVINPASEGLNYAVSVTSPVSKINMKIYTNEPGIQFYGGNFLNGMDHGKNGVTYNHRSAFCLETQHFPDSPNKPEFPTTVLNPGEKYYSICIYKFGIEK
jgi:aldose 1-epimerase